MEEQPLARTLTLVLRLLVDEMHARLAERGYGDLRPAHGYVLNAARPGTATASSIAQTLGMTKQGAAKLITELVETGYLARQRSGSDARARPVKLTRRGNRALETAARIQNELEAEWSDIASARDMAAFRRVLSQVLQASDAEENPPPLRPSW